MGKGDKASKKYICQACQKPISPERFFGDTVACDCGWTFSLSAEKKGFSLDTTSVILVLVAFGMILGFIHVFHWSSHSIRIIPLKAQQALGLADAPQLRQIASICKERKNWDCVIRAHSQTYEKDSGEIEVLGELAKLYMDLGNKESGLDTYRTYFESGGGKAKARYAYAKLLGGAGKPQEAISQYQILLKSQGDKVHAGVVRSYVLMLTNHKMWKLAKQEIESYRQKSQSAALFMEDELKKIQGHLQEAI